MTAMPEPPALTIDVIELNEHAPRPFVFTEPALCLRDAIRACGLGSNHYVNFADPASLCIVLGALPPLLGPMGQLDPRKTMVFNLEQLGSTSAVIDSQYIQWLRRWLVLDYHSENVQRLRVANGPDQQVLELPLVPGPSILFRPDLAPQKPVDVLFFGSLNERRAAVLREIEQAGLRVETVTGAYAEELAPAIRRARLVLHVHYYETGLFPIARFLQPAVQGVPIVCENAVHSKLADWSRSGILFARYHGLADACRALISSDEEQRTRAAQVQRFAAHIDFTGPLNQVLEALARRLAQPPPAKRAADEPAVQGLAPAQPIAPPLSEAAGDEPPLSDQEIEAILEREAGGLPPPVQVPVPPLALAQRHPGQGRWGRVLLWLVIVVSVASLIHAIR